MPWPCPHPTCLLCSASPLTLATLDQHMITVEAGSFEIGSEAYRNEKPIHTVKLASFPLCRYPVRSPKRCGKQ